MTEHHRRAEIINAIVELFEILLKPTDTSEYPIEVKTVLKSYRRWTALKKQGAIPAIMVLSGRRGRKDEAETVGYQHEVLPFSVITVLEETDKEYPLIDQDSDMHYSIESILNINRQLGIEGVRPDGVKITEFETTEEAIHPFLMTKYRITVEHEYWYTSSA